MVTFFYLYSKIEYSLTIIFIWKKKRKVLRLKK